MKAIIFLIALFIISTQAAYMAVPPSDYNNPIIMQAEQFGINFTIKSLVNEGKLINVTYHVKKTNGIWQQTNKDVIDYKYNLTLTNIQDDIVNSNFVVEYNTTTKKYRVVSTVSTISYGIATEATYRHVPKSRWTMKPVNVSIDFGVNYVAMQLISQGKIPNGTYKKSVVYDVLKQLYNPVVINHKIEVAAQNADKTASFNSTVFVKYNPHTGVRSVYAWSFKLPPM